MRDLIDMKKQYMLRNGKTVHLITTPGIGNPYILGFMHNCDGERMLGSWRGDGSYYTDRESEFDLIPIPIAEDVDLTKKYITEDGLAVILTEIIREDLFPLKGLIQCGSDERLYRLACWSLKGKYSKNQESNPLNLVLKKD